MKCGTNCNCGPSSDGPQRVSDAAIAMMIPIPDQCPTNSNQVFK